MTRLSRQEWIEGLVARTALGLPERLVRGFGGPSIVRGERTLDPQVRLALRLNKAARKKHSHELSVPEARRALEVTCAQMAGPTAKLQSVRDGKLAGRRVRIYRPLGGAEPGPALLYFHGGGHVVGSLDSHDVPCRQLAARTPCTVVSVEYRLAPEHPFPASIDDCTAAFRALVAEAAGLGVDAERIAIGGDSAGGNIAAVVALDTRRDGKRPCFQLLVYPSLDMTLSSPSMTELSRGFFLELETIAWFRNHYMGDADQRQMRASPLLADEQVLKELPPALVITAGFDPLRDDGDAYVERLREAGVSVAHHQHPGLFHGFWNTTTVMREAGRAFDEAVGVLRAAFAGALD